MSLAGILYVVFNLVFLILFIVEAVCRRQEVTEYAFAGLLLGIGVVIFDLAVLTLGDSSAIIKQMGLPVLVAIDLLTLVKTAIFAAVGMYCCAQLNITSAPLLLGQRGRPIVAPPGPTEVEAAISYPEPVVIQEVWSEPATVSDVPDTDEGRPTWSWGLVCAVMIAGAAVVYSTILFSATSPSISPALRDLLEQAEELGAQFGLAAEPSLMMAVVVCAFAFGEEILFRLSIQNFLAHKCNLSGSRYWIAVVVTSGIWSLAHANTLDPEWVKFAQVFPLGIALGFLFRRFGLEICIVAHGVFNIVMMLIAEHLFEI